MRWKPHKLLVGEDQQSRAHCTQVPEGDQVYFNQMGLLFLQTTARHLKAHPCCSGCW